MKKKVIRIAKDLAATISQWDGVEAILLGEAADIEVIDPYFTIDLDVYIRGRIPDAEERRERLSDPEGYESSPADVDSFSVEELPVTLHFMETLSIDALVHRLIDSSWAFHETGTNVFYRIERGETLYSRGGWLAAVRASRAEIPDGFWTGACARSFTAAERALADLGAACFASDDLLFLLSSSRLLRAVASFLFSLNRQFEPSGRMLATRIKSLPVVPEGFAGQLDNFLRPEEALSREAKREIAQHIVRSLAPLGEDPPRKRDAARGAGKK